MYKIFTILLLGFAFANAQVPQLVINEFLASNDTFYADENGEYDDFIEIYNAGSEAVDIGGMYITDDLTEPTMYQIPTTDAAATTIKPGGHILLWADKEPEQGILHVNLKLGGSGEQIGLYTSAQEVIDTLTYDAQETDETYGRYPNGSDTWQSFKNGSPGVTNKIVPIFINEFLASNDACCADENGEFDDFIELYNAGGFPVNIQDMYITDDLANYQEYQIPDTDSAATSIEPGAFLVLWADKQSEQGILHVELKLSGGGEQIGLYTKDGEAIDTLTYSEQKADTSYGRIMDAGSEWAAFSTTSMGKSNSEGVIVTSIGIKNPYTVQSLILNQNYPNPFNPATQISYTLKQAGKVSLKIYDIQGRFIETLFSGYKQAGGHNVEFNANHLASGVYLFSLQAGNSVQTKKMTLLK